LRKDTKGLQNMLFSSDYNLNIEDEQFSNTVEPPSKRLKLSTVSVANAEEEELPPFVVPERAIVVVAHPDDAEWYSGGLLANLIKKNCQITLVIVTKGEKGTEEINRKSGELALTRRIEQQTAAKVIGVTNVEFLTELDGELVVTKELKNKLVQIYRKVKPQLLITFDPWKRYELHTDHINVGKAALESRLEAKLPLFHPELLKSGLDPWPIKEILLFNAEVPNHFEDISDSWDLKALALTKFKSQDVGTESSLGSLKKENEKGGRRIGKALAECYRRIVIENTMSTILGTK